MSRIKEYKGRDITVYFEGARCIHSRYCVLGLPDVFRANAQGDWIVPDNASPEKVTALVQRCPSGALSYKRPDDVGQETAPMVNVIRVLENGPLAVHADLHIEGQKPVFRATLCRCGASKIKPWCDGSHKDINFVATGEPEIKVSSPLPKRDGELHITPVKNGPLMLTGNVEICTGTGRTINRCEQAALCRCGASSNKPFCDGSHMQSGFAAD